MDLTKALENLHEELGKIKDNNPKQIQLVTLMAYDYHEFAKDVVQLIVKHIKELPSDLKLIGMYVMDSIIKFSGVGTDNYRHLFSAELMKLFLDIYEKIPEANRQTLRELRSTWQPLLLKYVLYKLDIEVNNIDQTWPIFDDFTSQPKPSTEPKPAETASQPIENVEVTKPSSNDIAVRTKAAGRNTTGHCVVEGIVSTVAPIDTWEACEFPATMMKNIPTRNYKAPRDIQKTIVPLILDNYDVIAHGGTKSRMTACLLMSLISECMEAKKTRAFSPKRGHPFALIICGNIGIAKNGAKLCRKFAHGTKVSVFLMHEQVEPNDLSKNLDKECNLLFITPSCCSALFQNKTFKGEYLRFLVLNEAEMILNNQQNVDYITSVLRDDLFARHYRRQTLILSEILTESSLENARLMTCSNRCAYVRWIDNQSEKRKSDGENSIEEEPFAKKLRPDEELQGETCQRVNVVTQKFVDLDLDDTQSLNGSSMHDDPNE